MNYSKVIVLFCLFFSTSVFSGAKKSISSKTEIKKMKWGDVDVVWVEDNKFPTYNIYVYFADGALSDTKKYAGETDMMFSLLDYGTNRYTKDELFDYLDYYGSSIDFNVTHEYSTVSINGLTKDIDKTLKLFCHMFKDARYPVYEIRNHKKLLISKYKNLIANHSALSSRIVRELSLRDTPVKTPVGGKISSIKNITRNALLKKKKYFNDKVKKRIYISGPKSVLISEKIFRESCGWDSKSASFERKFSLPKKDSQNKKVIYFSSVPNANQAQIRVSGVLNQSKKAESDLLTLSSSFLGGGFTSVLMRELRVKRGLTYSVSAFAANQKFYGRSGISTFTPNKSVVNLLENLEKAIDKVAKNDFSKDDLERTKKYLAGSHLFSYEKSSSFLYNLLFLDHLNKDYKTMYEFPDKIKEFSSEDISRIVKEVFTLNNMDILVLGDKKILKDLRKKYKVKTLNYKNFL